MTVGFGMIKMTKKKYMQDIYIFIMVSSAAHRKQETLLD